MTQKFTAEEVRKIATNLDDLVAPNLVLNRASAALRAYADTLSKPTDSGRVGLRAKVDQLVGAELERAWFAICDALSEIDPDWMMHGPVGVDAAVATIRALAAQGQGEAVAWRIDTDDDVERVAKAAGWDNRRYMTPADYAIWCIRMREFVRLAVDRPASPAGVPDDTRLLDALVRESWDLRCFDFAGGEDVGWRVVGHYMAAPNERIIAEVFTDDPRQAIEAALAAAPSAPEGGQ